MEHEVGYKRPPTHASPPIDGQPEAAAALLLAAMQDMAWDGDARVAPMNQPVTGEENPGLPNMLGDITRDAADIDPDASPEVADGPFAAVVPEGAAAEDSPDMRTGGAELQALIAQARQGGEAGNRAFAKLYNMTIAHVRRAVFSKVPHQQDAEDIISEVYIRVFSNLEVFEDGGTKFLGWLAVTVRNCVMDYYRSAYKRRVTVGDVSGELLLDKPAAETHQNDNAALRQLLVDTLRSMKDQNMDRKVTVLLRAYGYSVAEIASHLRISEGTVKSRHFYMLAALRRRLLKDHGPGIFEYLNG